MARAGEAFFTTKAPGSGLGIGLFLANATIERAGGTVRLHNREGGGAVTVVTSACWPASRRCRPSSVRKRAATC